MDPLLRHLRTDLVETGNGDAGACADDVGTVLQDLTALRILPPVFMATESLAALRLQTAKTVLVPLWCEVSPETRLTISESIRQLVPEWSRFKVEGGARYLGVLMGPGAANLDQWKAAEQKWLERSYIIPTSRAPADASLRSYSAVALT
eukprot:5595325-Pyramimonas_sp.AAC.1